ncbi:MAG: hypothetical protein J6Z08_08670 [Elusimicrobiales bacterium]|jgi:hypothetical protein|nr:hypothetical protein [Elusimicrobiales bacterium]
MGRTFLFISPQYPQRLRFLANRLKAAGFTVVGIGDSDWGSLNPELQRDLAEYCKVNMNCYRPDGSIDQDVYAGIFNTACYLADKYGKPEYIESFNEWWLPLDAQLRADLGVQGNKPDELRHLNRKSLMKERFRRAGVNVVPGKLVENISGMIKFMNSCGNDIIVKPDHGVGASSTYRIRTREEAERFFANKNPEQQFYMEKFISGSDRELFSFDGITDADGKPAFYIAHHYCDGIMEVVDGGTLSYNNIRLSDIPEDLVRAGMASVESFNIRKNFFHIEFFRSDGKFFGLEINARPPGVVTLDMDNHARGMDLWALYADICANGHTAIEGSQDRICGYVGRLNSCNYRLSHEEIMRQFGNEIVFDMPMDSRVMGDYCYLTLSDSPERCEELRRFITELR